jgi:hypothetical protein
MTEFWKGPIDKLFFVIHIWVYHGLITQYYKCGVECGHILFFTIDFLNDKEILQAGNFYIH